MEAWISNIPIVSAALHSPHSSLICTPFSDNNVNEKFWINKPPQPNAYIMCNTSVSLMNIIYENLYSLYGIVVLDIVDPWATQVKTGTTGFICL